MRGHAEQAHSRGVKLALGPSSSGFENMTHEANRSPILVRFTTSSQRAYPAVIISPYLHGTTKRARHSARLPSKVPAVQREPITRAEAQDWSFMALQPLPDGSRPCVCSCRLALEPRERV